MDESNKRQRTTTSDNNELQITDLPDGLLVGISSYLVKPLVALFAIAMKPNNSQQTQTSKAIISSTSWSVLDFSDIEKTLAAKLSDDDIDKMLKSIDAVNSLRILKLGGCVKIRGNGLDTLCTATAIQQIDLSLVGKHESPILELKPLLSVDIVLPILYSIINRGSSLKQLEFPVAVKWRSAPSTEMDRFLERYDQYLTNQRYNCSKCEQVCLEGMGIGWVCNEEGNWYGLQNFTCSGCLNHFCTGENCRDENGDTYSNYCKKCEKEYCKNCSGMTRCGSCYADVCNGCSDMRECDEEDCDDVLCEYCFEKRKCHICNRMKCSSCVRSYRCTLDSCSNVICDDCVERKGEGGECDGCGGGFCSTECRYLACGSDATKACPNCSLAAASDFRRKLQESKKEIEELCQGMDDLYKKYINVEEEK